MILDRIKSNWAASVVGQQKIPPFSSEQPATVTHLQSVLGQSAPTSGNITWPGLPFIVWERPAVVSTASRRASTTRRQRRKHPCGNPRSKTGDVGHFISKPQSASRHTHPSRRSASKVNSQFGNRVNNTPSPFSHISSSSAEADNYTHDADAHAERVDHLDPSYPPPLALSASFAEPAATSLTRLITAP